MKGTQRKEALEIPEYGLPNLGLDGGLTTSRKKKLRNVAQGFKTWTDSVERSKQRKVRVKVLSH
jgi:hypothetical protein